MIKSLHKKRILIIDACQEDSSMELANVASQASSYGLECTFRKLQQIKDVDNVLKHSEPFDYLYLCTHGDKQNFGDNCSLDVPWAEFANAVCRSNCMKPDSIFFLACCRGGLNQVAFTLFKQCPNIDYVFGPRTSLTSAELLIGFNIFLYNVEHKGNDPVIAAEKIKAATDIRFKCFDRAEVETDCDYINFKPDKRISPIVLTPSPTPIPVPTYVTKADDCPTCH